MGLSACYLDCSIVPSRIHGQLLIALHGLSGSALTGVSLSLAAMSPYLLVALLVAIACSYVHHRRLARLMAPSSVVRLLCSGQDWQIVSRDGRLIKVRPVGEIVLFRYLAVVTLEDSQGQKYPVPVLPDSTSQDEFRRLKVFLRFVDVAGTFQ
ncbi:MAG: protein YgfX [Pseudomonadales bacterium]